jgi:hypothetical protein
VRKAVHSIAFSVDGFVFSVESGHRSSLAARCSSYQFGRRRLSNQ